MKNSIRKLFSLLPLVTLLLCLSLNFSYAENAAQLVKNIRGVDRSERHTFDPVRSTLSGLFYIPRLTVDAALYGAGKTAEVLSDKDFIERVKDILYIYDDKLLMYPMMGFASGFRPTQGGGLYYKDGGLRAHFRSEIFDAHYWSFSLKGSYRKNVGNLFWKSSLLGVLETKDDHRFYGLGADPQQDTRNRFLADNDYGIYSETRRKLQWDTELFSPLQTYGVKYLGYIHRRSFENQGHGIDDLYEILDVTRIPGFSHPVHQLYNELSVIMDTRKDKKLLSPGFRGETYAGISTGIRGDHADLFRTGFDVAGFIPVYKDNRLIVPRVVFDLVENLDSTAIPFSEYPRHHTFRGVLSREILRSERVSMVPSLEYQWPLSHMLTGSIFFDTLIVGSQISDFEWGHAVWAAGSGISFHYFKQEFARIEIAGGSEGFQATVSIGKPLRTNHRADW